jgi:hypothetical protein
MEKRVCHNKSLILQQMGIYLPFYKNTLQTNKKGLHRAASLHNGPEGDKNQCKY